MGIENVVGIENIVGIENVVGIENIVGIENCVDDLNVSTFERECKKRIHFHMSGKTKLKGNSKLKLNDQIKQVFGKEKYLDDIARWVFQSTHADRINVSVAARIIFK